MLYIVAVSVTQARLGQDQARRAYGKVLLYLRSSPSKVSKVDADGPMAQAVPRRLVEGPMATIAIAIGAAAAFKW